MHKLTIMTALTGCLLASANMAHAMSSTPIFWGPTPYLSSSDIPAGFYQGGSPVLLEDLEDNTLESTLSANTGGVIDASGWGTLVDSVDADDGQIDGLGNGGHSWFSGDVTFTFVGSSPLPTAFGLVWTDGSGTITFSAKDALGQSLGTQSYTGIPDGTFGGTTIDDHFFGVQFAGGIKSITIGTGGGIEVDHIQYGQMVSSVPEPTSALMLSLGLLGLIRVRRTHNSAV
jgi:hypothetical protein